MVREQRIRLMAQMAIYEKRHRESIKNARQWFRGDYVGSRMLKNLFLVTLAYLAGFAFYVALTFDQVMQKLGTMDIQGLITGTVVCYVAVAAVYLACTYLVYSFRYYRFEKEMLIYRHMAERLEEEYRSEELELMDERRRRAHNRRR